MQNMNLLLKKTPQSEIKNHVLPMIYQALEQNSPQLQVCHQYWMECLFKFCDKNYIFHLIYKLVMECQI